MKDRLQQTQIEVPYFSGAKLILNAGKNCPPQLGGNCIFENNHLAGLLRKDGYSPSFISVSNERVHYATLCRENGELYYLDPFLLSEEPINLSEIFQSQESKIYDALPVVDGCPSKVVVKATGTKTFTVSLFGHRNGKQIHIRNHHYDLLDQVDQLPAQDDPNLISIKQKAITLRVVGQDGVVSKSSLLTESGTINFLRFNGRAVFLKEKEHPGAVMKELEVVAKSINISVWEMFNRMHQANGLHHNIHPCH